MKKKQDLLQLSWHGMLASRWMDGRMFVKLPNKTKQYEIRNYGDRIYKDIYIG